MPTHGVTLTHEQWKRFQDALRRRGLDTKIRPGLEVAIGEFIDQEGQLLPPGLPKGMEPIERKICAEIIELWHRDELTRDFILSTIKHLQSFKPG